MWPRPHQRLFPYLQNIVPFICLIKVLSRFRYLDLYIPCIELTYIAIQTGKLETMVSLSNGLSVKIAQGVPTWQSSSSRCRTWWWRWTDGDVGPSTAQTLSNWMNGGMNEWMNNFAIHRLKLRIKPYYFCKGKTSTIKSKISCVTSTVIKFL